MAVTDVLISEIYTLAEQDSASVQVGVVEAVYIETGRLDALVAGVPLKDIPYSAELSPIVGQTVWLVRQGSWLLAIGAAASTGQTGEQGDAVFVDYLGQLTPWLIDNGQGSLTHEMHGSSVVDGFMVVAGGASAQWSAANGHLRYDATGTQFYSLAALVQARGGPATVNLGMVCFDDQLSMVGRVRVASQVVLPEGVGTWTWLMGHVRGLATDIPVDAPPGASAPASAPAAAPLGTLFWRPFVEAVAGTVQVDMVEGRRLDASISAPGGVTASTLVVDSAKIDVLTIPGGSDGEVLTSDVNGVASWEPMVGNEVAIGDVEPTDGEDLWVDTSAEPSGGSTGTFLPASGWADYGDVFGGLLVSRVGLLVTVEGLLRNTNGMAVAANAGYVIGSLPPGFRPVHVVLTTQTMTLTNTSLMGCRVDFSADGQIRLIPYGSGTFTAHTGWVAISATFRGA